MKKEPFYITPQMAIQERIEEFKKCIPEEFPEEFPEELKGDFAAELQWKSWQSHLTELQEKLNKK